MSVSEVLPQKQKIKINDIQYLGHQSYDETYSPKNSVYKLQNGAGYNSEFYPPLQATTIKQSLRSSVPDSPGIKGQEGPAHISYADFERRPSLRQQKPNPINISTPKGSSMDPKTKGTPRMSQKKNSEPQNK